MNLSLTLNIVIILIGLMFMSGENTYKRRRAYMIICFMLFMFFNAFKSLEVGSDTYTYFVQTSDFYQISWSEQWLNFIDRYFGAGGDYDEGFVFYVKFVQLFSRNFIVLLFISSLLFFVPLGKILLRSTTNFRQLIFAFVLYNTLMYGGSMFSRQQIATIFLLWAFIQVLDNKYWAAIIFNILAAGMHMSSLIFLVVPLMARYAKNKVKSFHLLSFCMIPIAVLIPSQLILYASAFLGSERYADYADSYGGAAYTFTILMEALSLLCYIGFKKEDLEKDSNLYKLYIMLPFVTMFVPFIIQNGVFIRLSKYFFIYMMILVPKAFENMFNYDKDNHISWAYIISIGILVIYSMLNSSLYYTIWDMPYNPIIS